MTNQTKQKSSELLNGILADTAVLLVQTLHYHWNLEGREFHDYHLLLDKQYHQLFEDLDLIAERVRAVDGKALGSMHHFIQKASLKEDVGPLPKPHEMIKNIHAQYNALIKTIRIALETLEQGNDFGTKKMLEDVIERHEKTNWMLRSLLA